MLICAGDKENFDIATPIGIGLIQSAINLTKICLMDPPKFLLFIASAGSYGNLNIFDIVQSKTAVNIEHSFFTNKSYSPIDNAVSAGESKYIVNSSNYITKNKNMAKLYLNKNIDLENMEYYSILNVAKNFEIPCGAIFVISNYCYENANEEFIKNHNKAKEKLMEYLKKKNLA